MGWIPIVPNPTARLHECRSLSRNSYWNSNHSLEVLDLAPGGRLSYGAVGCSSRQYLVHVTWGTVSHYIAGFGGTDLKCWVGEYNVGTFLQVPELGLMFENESTTEPARLVMMSHHLKEPMPLAIVQGHLDAVPYEDRHIGESRLKSIWPQLKMGDGAGYEVVEVRGRVPRHCHVRSAAIWLVIEGEGYVGYNLHGHQHVYPVSPGVYGVFARGQEHGFYFPNGGLLISAQVPGIEDDYRMSGSDYEYPL